MGHQNTKRCASIKGKVYSPDPTVLQQVYLLFMIKVDYTANSSASVLTIPRSSRFKILLYKWEMFLSWVTGRSPFDYKLRLIFDLKVYLVSKSASQLCFHLTSLSTNQIGNFLMILDFI